MTVNVVVQSIIDENFIERRPVFSEDGNSLYIIDRDRVKEFSVSTSECCSTFFQDGDGVRQDRSNVVGITLHENYLYGCTSNCTFLRWSRTGELILSAKRALNSSSLQVIDMRLVDYKHDFGQITQPELLVFIKDSNNPNLVHIHIYSLIQFNEVKRFTVEGRPDPKLLALGSINDKHFIVSAVGRKMFVHNLGGERTHRHKITNPSCDWSVVRCVPFSDTVACGDEKGKVYLYQNIFKFRKKTKWNFVPAALYHWHFHTVQDIAFSPNGTQMYTGGLENVLVRWNVKNPTVKEFTPRIQSAIQHITISPSNTTVAASLMDNGIALISSQMNLFSTIQKLTWNLRPVLGQEILPAKMSYDPNSRCAVMNGRHGHLQFVSLSSQELVYSMDVCACNFVREPDTDIYQLEVVRVAISQDGGWMATVEARDDHCTSKEVYMKMWQYKHELKGFVMNSCINLPHGDSDVIAMRFQPSRSLTGEQRTQSMLVTSGADRKFRVWSSGKVLIGSKGEYAITWSNDRVGFYRDKEGGPVAFSYDGSVLAVGFGSSLTVWNADTIEMSSSLTRGSDVIRFIEFEQIPSSHVVITASSSVLQMWNLLTLSLVWCVKTNVTLLTADPLSEYFAAFTADHQLFVFNVTDPEPVFKKADIAGGKKQVVAAIFVPRNDVEKEGDSALVGSGRPSWLRQSKLYYLTESQEFKAVDVKSTLPWQSLPAVSMGDGNQSMRGVFAQLTAKKVRQESADSGWKPTGINGIVGKPVEDTTRKLLNLPIHSVPNISLLCEDFLACQLSTKLVFPSTLEIEKIEEKMLKRKGREMKKKKGKKGKIPKIEDLSLQNLFSFDTVPDLDLIKECVERSDKEERKRESEKKNKKETKKRKKKKKKNKSKEKVTQIDDSFCLENLFSWDTRPDQSLVMACD